MFHGLRTIVYPVSDLGAARAWYSAALGIQPYFEEPFYVGFHVGGCELGLDPNGVSGSGDGSGPITYWGVDSAEHALAQLLAQGAAEHQAVTDVGGGILVASVLDPFGNVLGVIENPHYTSIAQTAKEHGASDPDTWRG